MSDMESRIKVGDIIRYKGQDDTVVVGYVYECDGDSCKICILEPFDHDILYYGANGPARSSIEVIAHCSGFKKIYFHDMKVCQDHV